LRRFVVWATRSKTDARSLRWRIAGSYAALLLAAIAIIAVVLTFELRSILLDEARAKTDRVGGDIAQLVRRTGQLLALGEPSSSFEQDLLQPGNLEHWSSPTTFLEVDRGDGYPAGKSGNMGSALLAPSPPVRSRETIYTEESNKALGDVLVRDEFFRFDDGSTIIVKVAESLDIYDQSLARIRQLLVIVVAIAAIVLLVASALISHAMVEPINRLIAAMREIGSEQLSRRIGWSRRRDEIGELAETFDEMLARLEDGFARERQFISDASHELKTPLTIINANAQMLERWGGSDPDVRRDSLRAIREESGALAAMVNGMLLLAKAESGERVSPERIELDDLAADAVRSVEPRATDKGLALTLVRSGAVPALQVLGDASLIRQLITNLVDNAIKFTERGGIEVRIAARPDEVEIAVTDTGVGIDDEALERVFDRFYRTDRSRSREVEGTGLGLAIVRSIARVHHGSVAAERNPAGGSTFRVALPRATFIAPS